MDNSIKVPKELCSKLLTIDNVKNAHDNDVANQKDKVEKTEILDWEEELNREAHLQKVENWQHFLAIKIEKDTGMRVQWRDGLGDHQHMSKALVAAGKLKSVLYYIALDLSVVYGVFFFSEDMVSFPGVLHGGSQFTAYDETCGQLAFLILPGGCVTVHSDICFKKPFPAGRRKALVTARLEKIEGRKAIITGTLRDSPDGPDYSQVRMTYVRMPEQYRRVQEKLLQSNL